MDDALALRPTLAAWLAEYDEIENDYIQRLRALGIEFAKPHACDARVARLRAELASGGARVRNAGASICSGALSSACVACTGDCGSKTFFLSLACNRSCYFCFNSNQAGSERLRCMNEHWRAEVDAYFDSIGGPENATHLPVASRFFMRSRRLNSSRTCIIVPLRLIFAFIRRAIFLRKKCSSVCAMRAFRNCV